MTTVIDGTEDVDPDDVGDVIRRFTDELPHENTAIEHVALREAYYFLKDAGRASADAIALAVWDESNLSRQYPRRSTWWTDAGEPFLPLLPGVVRDDVGWRYDPDADDSRPPVPDNPTDPSADDVDAVLQSFNYPGVEGDRVKTKNRLGVKRAFEYLQEHGEADAADLKDQFTPSNYGRQEGHFDNPHDWFREVGRPVLRDLPGVDPPRVAGQPWRYVGVNAPTDEDR
ncbi:MULTISPECIES: hypothetical protein [unclassified Haloferax]|uniref:hypothetical protein n=1 Tax=unclassified Haloferax TaxID=2625095 RepID=UPI0002AFD2C8|nr:MULTISPECIES: hypothetical protein [unclassified Haloferax]ELZ54844.1 hypothetical protein C460_17933 [Haloferax sp. ATCC BAA-646]ELZ65746.1 hypothetical protein C458_13258 [Haloferax sp. ATCC BAA-644]ELZ66011.1 hypothetical protein C459_05340 [Haloferax sp. ATCC BAA-645]